MTASEIRSILEKDHTYTKDIGVAGLEYKKCVFLQEIAAQLADLNERLRSVNELEGKEAA